MSRDPGPLPWHLQLAGPAARPLGHPDLSFVLPTLAIGEYPIPEDALWLRDTHRFAAVVSLQDDADLHRKGLRLAELQRAYADAGLVFQRHPVEDGNQSALRATLEPAVASVHAQIVAGRRTYLHCNAGLNRAPTVAIAYLHVHGGLPLAAAHDAVKRVRACVPYLRLLRTHYGG